MKNEIVKQDAGAHLVDRPGATWTPEQMELLKRTIAEGATDDELALFQYQCHRTGLDPFKKQIFFQKRSGKVVFITSIDGFRSIAASTGTAAGMDDILYEDGLSTHAHMMAARGTFPRTATATIYRVVAGTRVPFTATVRWVEFYPGKRLGFMWDKMPYHMLGKCAEAQALRKAFPQELGGMYAQEEMHQAGMVTEPMDQNPHNLTETAAGLVDLVDKGGAVPGVDRQTGEVVEAETVPPPPAPPVPAPGPSSPPKASKSLPAGGPLYGDSEGPQAPGGSCSNENDLAHYPPDVTVYRLEVAGSTAARNKEKLQEAGFSWDESLAAEGPLKGKRHLVMLITEDRLDKALKFLEGIGDPPPRIYVFDRRTGELKDSFFTEGT